MYIGIIEIMKEPLENPEIPEPDIIESSQSIDAPDSIKPDLIAPKGI